MCFPGNLSCRGRGGYRRCRADPREAGFGGPIRRGVSFRESGNRRLASWPVQWRVGKERRRVGPASWSNRQAGSSAAGWPECRCRPHVRSFPTWTPLRPRPDSQHQLRILVASPTLITYCVRCDRSAACCCPDGSAGGHLPPAHRGRPGKPKIRRRPGPPLRHTH